ncbi:MAG: bacterioferritin [Anaerolineaceae bacterium]
MKGNEQILTLLNARLSEELTAINQYIVHSEMCANWGYDKLHDMIEKRAIGEMKHAEEIIGRLLFLEGTPIVSNLNKMHIGDNVEKMLENDRQAEMDAIQAYRDSIRIAMEVGDFGTYELFEEILVDEEEHIDELEEQQDQISQMGVQIYLSRQLE